MKNKSWMELFWGATATLVVMGTIFAIIWPIYSRMRENAYPSSCQSNLRQIGLAVSMYGQDYNERFPLVNVNDVDITPNRPLGWADALQPYLKSLRVFQCPSQNDRESPEGPNALNYTDYWYNARLSGAAPSKIKHTDTIIMSGDGNDGTDATNARYSLSSFPASWRAWKGSASRHLDGANYAFVDGHVKWLRPKQASNEKPTGKNTTLAIR